MIQHRLANFRSLGQETSRRSRRSTPRLSFRSPGVLLAVVVLVLALVAALAPQLFTRLDPISGTFEPLLPPSVENWFGTDAVGRDVFSRVVYGTRESLLGAAIAVGIGLVVGTILGVVAGTTRAEAVIMRVVDVLLSIPALLLSLSVIIILGFSTTNAAIAVGITSVATFARLARSQVLTVKDADFVEAARTSGASALSVLVHHIVPNSLTPVLALAAMQCGSAILQLATLGFLGYGAPPPTPEWGLIIADARDYIATSWWLTVFPGLVIVVVVLATHHLSHALRKEA